MTKQQSPSPQPDPQDMQQQLEAEKAKRLQTMADFDNYRKRMESEKAKFGVLTNMAVVQSILEVLDDIQLAQLDQQLATPRASEVLQILRDKLLAALSVAGVEAVPVMKGDKFDPGIMEAVTTVPASKQLASDTVVDVISAAFRYRNQDTLLRTAKVVVAK